MTTLHRTSMTSRSARFATDLDQFSAVLFDFRISARGLLAKMAMRCVLFTLSGASLQKCQTGCMQSRKADQSCPAANLVDIGPRRHLAEPVFRGRTFLLQFMVKSTKPKSRLLQPKNRHKFREDFRDEYTITVLLGQAMVWRHLISGQWRFGFFVRTHQHSLSKLGTAHPAPRECRW